VYHLKRIGVRAAGEFEKMLDYDPIPFLMKAKSDTGNWWMTDEFLILLMLVRSSIKKLSVRDLVKDGWHENITVMVIRAAKEDIKR